jgi:hypothetical protein
MANGERRTANGSQPALRGKMRLSTPMPIESYRDREEFLQFLRRANGSLVEVETRLVLSADLEFSNQQEVGGMSKQRQNLGK